MNEELSEEDDDGGGGGDIGDVESEEDCFLSVSTFEIEFVEGCDVCFVMFNNLDKSKVDVALLVAVVAVDDVLAGFILLSICFSLSVSSADLNIDMAMLMAISPDIAGCLG